MKYKNIREEELKNKVGSEWFKQFDTTEIIGNIDFTVFPKQDSLFGRTKLTFNVLLYFRGSASAGMAVINAYKNT
jgi:hypothetical protein